MKQAGPESEPSFQKCDFFARQRYYDLNFTRLGALLAEGRHRISDLGFDVKSVRIYGSGFAGIGA